MRHATCITPSVTPQELQAECNNLSDEQRSWLAIQFTACQQRVTRQDPFTCKKGRRNLKACIESMDLKTHMDYTTFLANVHR